MWLAGGLVLVILASALPGCGGGERRATRSRASKAVLGCIMQQASGATQVTDLAGDTVAAGLQPPRSAGATVPRALAQEYLAITWPNGGMLEAGAYKSPALAASLLGQLRQEQGERGAAARPEQHGAIVTMWRSPPSDERAAIVQRCLT